MVSVSTEAGAVRLVEQPRVVDASVLSATWPPPEEEAPLAWTPPTSHGFGLRVHKGGPAPHDALSYMFPAFRIQARDHVLHASWHWSGRSSADPMASPHMLVAYIRETDPKAGRRNAVTVVSALRLWKDEELSRACHDALYLVAPAEHPDSPQTAAVRALHAKREHDWWLRSCVGLDDAALVERAKLAVREKAELVSEGPYGLFNAADDREYWDAVESYRHSFRHYDIEFKARGLPNRIVDIEFQLEDEAALQQLSGP